MTTKILALTDALGNLVHFRLMPGNRFDSVGVAPLIEGVEFGALLAGLSGFPCAAGRLIIRPPWL